MTFWQDARPASPRFRRPRLPRRGTRGPRRVIVTLLATSVLAAGALSVVRAEEPASTAAARARRLPPDPAPRVIPARWSRTLPDYPATMLPDHHRGVVVIGTSWVSAVKATDGALRWQARVERLNPFGAIGGDTVLMSTETGFVALDRETGAPRWRTDTPETPGPVALVGPPRTPAVAAVSTDEGGLVGLDSRTGRPRWSIRFSGHIRGVPAADHTSGTIAAVWQDDATTRLRVVDAAGTVRWEHELEAMAGSPIVTGGPVAGRLVVVGAGSGRFDGVVRAFALVDGSPRWQSRVGASFQARLEVLVDGHDLFVVDQLGTVTRLDVATGERRWATDTRAAEIHARPVRVGAAVLVQNEAGEVVTLDRVTGAIRARRRAAGLPVGLVVARGLVVVAQRLVGREHLQAFRAVRVAATARNRQ